MEQEQDEKNWAAAMADMQARLEVLEAAELERVRQAEVAAEVARARAEEEKKARVQRREKREAQQAKSDAELAALMDQLAAQQKVIVEAQQKRKEEEEKRREVHAQVAVRRAELEARMQRTSEKLAVCAQYADIFEAFDPILLRPQVVALPGTAPSDTEKEKERVDEKKRDG